MKTYPDARGQDYGYATISRVGHKFTVTKFTAQGVELYSLKLGSEKAFNAWARDVLGCLVALE